MLLQWSESSQDNKQKLFGSTEIQGSRYWFHADPVGSEVWELNFYSDDEQMEYGYDSGYCFSVARSLEDAKMQCEELWEAMKGEAIRHAITEIEAEIVALKQRLRAYKDEIGDE